MITALATATAIVNAIQAFFTALAAAIPTVIGACSVVAALLPPPEDNGKLAKLHKVINTLAFNTLAFNVGHAKNAS